MFRLLLAGALALLLALVPSASASHFQGEHCFTDVRVSVEGDVGTISYDLAPYAGYSSIVVQKMTESGWVTIATAEHPHSGSTTFAVTAGETYEVRVVGDLGDPTYECPSESFSFTAVPFFPHPLAAVAAAVGTVGMVWVAMRRRT